MWETSFCNMPCWSKIELLDQGLHLYSLMFFTYVHFFLPIFMSFRAKEKNEGAFKLQARKMYWQHPWLISSLLPRFCCIQHDNPKTWSMHAKPNMQSRCLQNIMYTNTLIYQSIFVCGCNYGFVDVLDNRIINLLGIICYSLPPLSFC